MTDDNVRELPLKPWRRWSGDGDAPKMPREIAKQLLARWGFGKGSPPHARFIAKALAAGVADLRDALDQRAALADAITELDDLRLALEIWTVETIRDPELHGYDD